MNPVELWFKELEEKRPKTFMGIVKEDGVSLYNFVKERNIKTVVETGVCFGFSSTYILEGMGEGGKLISIEPFLKPLNEIVVPENLRTNWTIVEKLSVDCLDEVLKKNAPVDMFLHDSKHDYKTMMFEYTTAHNNGIKYIASDDVGGPYCGDVWKDFLTKYNYQDLLIGKRARVAWRK